MASRARYRHREFHIEPDREPDAEPLTFTMHCAVCGASSPIAFSAKRSVDWIARHLKSRPQHLTYREAISRPYRAVPGSWL